MQSPYPYFHITNYLYSLQVLNSHTNTIYLLLNHNNFINHTLVPFYGKWVFTTFYYHLQHYINHTLPRGKWMLHTLIHDLKYNLANYIILLKITIQWYTNFYLFNGLRVIMAALCYYFLLYSLFFLLLVL